MLTTAHWRVQSVVGSDVGLGFRQLGAVCGLPMGANPGGFQMARMQDADAQVRDKSDKSETGHSK